MTKKPDIRHPLFNKRIISLVGGFGSGKTEVAVNLARFLATSTDNKITLVDLDLVNPYFRTREAIEEMEAVGVDLIAPQGGKFYADLPILLPQVRGLVEKSDGILILDVGGDEQGTRAMASMADVFSGAEHDMLMVLNSRRPQTDNLAGCLKTMARVEKTAGMKFTGLISNSHMIDETTGEIIIEGYNLVSAVGRETGLPVAFVSIVERLIDGIDLNLVSCPVLPLTRSMLKPWERK